MLRTRKKTKTWPFKNCKSNVVIHRDSKVTYGNRYARQQRKHVVVLPVVVLLSQNALLQRPSWRLENRTRLRTTHGFAVCCKYRSDRLSCRGEVLFTASGQQTCWCVSQHPDNVTKAFDSGQPSTCRRVRGAKHLIPPRTHVCGIPILLTHTRSLTQTHTYTRTLPCTHTHTLTHTRACTQTRAHTYTQTHMQAH